MHVIYRDIWLFDGGRSRKIIWTKNSLSGHGALLPNFSVCKKKGIWRQFGRTKYLVILLFEQIDKLSQAPIAICFILPLPSFWLIVVFVSAHADVVRFPIHVHCEPFLRLFNCMFCLFHLPQVLSSLRHLFD